MVDVTYIYLTDDRFSKRKFREICYRAICISGFFDWVYIDDNVGDLSSPGLELQNSSEGAIILKDLINRLAKKDIVKITGAS